MLWLLASESDNGTIPFEVEDLAFRLREDPEHFENALKPLIASGFFEITAGADESASSVLAHEQHVAAPETESQQQTEEEKTTSVLQTDAPKLNESIPERKKAVRTAYTDDFNAWWDSYPIDPIMSKKAAFAQWERLTPQDRIDAMASLPAFLEFCRKDKTYRPVHAERFLSQRRFDGLKPQPKSAADDADKDALRARADRILNRGEYAGEIA